MNVVRVIMNLFPLSDGERYGGVAHGVRHVHEGHICHHSFEERREHVRHCIQTSQAAHIHSWRVVVFNMACSCESTACKYNVCVCMYTDSCGVK